MEFIREVDEVKVSLIVDIPAKVVVEVPAAWDVEPVLFRSMPK